MNWPRLSPPARKGPSLLLAAAAAVAVLSCAAPQPRLTESQRHGAETYKITCAVCHGAAGEGYKADRAPALADPDLLSSASDEFLARAVSEGRAGTTMSAWSKAHGGPMSPEDVSAMVAFMRSWDKGPRASLDERPAAGDDVRGVKLFNAECARCHGPNGVGGADIRIGDPGFLHSAGNGFLRYAIRNGRRNTPMAGFGGVLGDAGIEDVLAFLRTLESGPAAAAAALSAPLPLGPVPLNPGGPEPEGFTHFLTPADVIKTQLDRGAKLAILDSRAPADYVKEHIAGAVSVPFYNPAPYLASLPKDAWLVCYCACPHAESGQLAKNLTDNGFTKVTVLDEGLNYWKGKGYPLRAGQAP